MIASIDIGASTTKGVLVEGLKIVQGYSIPTTEVYSSALKILSHFITGIRDNNKVIDVVVVSGGGSRKIGDIILDLPVKKVNEIKAVGLGGLLLTEKNKGLIVSVGTGTAMVAAYDGGKRTNHVGGIGVGGGTILGLSKRLLGISDFKVLESMASRGDVNKVDLTVADIVGGPIGIIPGEATASNFGKLTNEATEDDIVAGIFNMVSQTIGVLSAMVAKNYNLKKDVILAGRLVKSKIVSEIIRNTTKIFGIKVHIPKDCEFCTALGAAGSIDRSFSVCQLDNDF